MNNVGIIAEYNPFHNGHFYHIEQTKKITGCKNIIAVMSGDFVQRGEPALINKYIRAEMALLNGVDIVIELPAIFSSSSAESFAFGAVKILNSLNVVDSLSFGSENGDIGQLANAAKILSSESDEFKILLRNELKRGNSFPVARQAAIDKIIQGPTDFFAHPNNILGIEYLKALNKLNSSIKAITVKRMASSHNSNIISGTICSASALRNAAANKNIEDIRPSVPPNIFGLLINEISGKKTASLNNLSRIFHYILKTQSPSELSKILDIDEGLENRLLRCSEELFYLEDIVKLAKTKRYTHTRLRRAALHILLSFYASDAALCAENNSAGYIRILGFKKEKSRLLNQIQHQASLPVITRMGKDITSLSPLAYSMLKKELRASDIYCLALDSHDHTLSKNNDMYKHPVII